MRSGAWSKTGLIAGVLGLVLGGCGNSAGGGAGGSPEGRAGSGGTSTASGAGGSGTGIPATGGAGGQGGAGSTGTGGWLGTGGAPASGGSGGGGGAAGAGGQTGSGGATAAGGTGAPTETGGKATSGGQSGAGTGGAMPTGGTTSAGGQPTTGGRSGGGGNSGAGGTASGGQSGTVPQRSISFGTLLDAQAVVAKAQQLAKSQAIPSAAGWQAKGDQHRKYRFADASADAPYRLYVPTTWDGTSSLPLAMFLHGSGSDENSYVDANNKQMLTLAQQRGYLLVAPLGDKGAYGNFLRLSSPFGKPEEAAKLMAQVTADSERTNALSEQDVINVLELVLAEYPIDRAGMFLFGHSMGSGGTWYIGGKYAGYWQGLAPMSGPFVQETVFPWDALRDTFLFVTEGTQTPSLEGSRALRDWLKAQGFKAEYEEVNADHGGMIPLVLPHVFDFFDRARAGS